MSAREQGDEIDVWVVEQALGTGGMGSVYRCHNRDAPRIKAAIKVLGEGLEAHEQARARFAREAEILFALDHPNIVKVRNIRLDASPPYIEMEFVDGTSLEDVLRGGPLSLERALGVAEQLISAVRFLHRNGVCHRDIKPANLLLGRGMVLKLVDFGLASDASAEHITAFGQMMGTVSYAPPEWVTPQQLDPVQWDLYAVGAVLYEMLTGAVAFPAPPGASPRQGAVKVMADKASAPHIDPGDAAPASVGALVRKLTARDAADRIGTAREAMGLLQRIIADEGIDTAALLQEATDPAELSARLDELLVSRTASTPALAPLVDSHRDLQEPQATVLDDDNDFAPAALSPDDTAAIRTATDAAGRASVVAASMGVLTLGGGVMALVAVMVAVVAVGAVVYLLVRPAPPPTHRPVAVVATGVGPDHEVGVRLDALHAVSVDGLRFRFPEVAPGEVTLSWSLGPGCRSLSCPGDGCGAWCAQGADVAVLEAGTGEAVLVLPVTAPPARELRISVPGDWPWAAVQIGPHTAVVADGTARVPSVAPGRYELAVAAGSCGEDIGCVATDTCPSDCSVSVQPLEVPIGAAPLDVGVALQPPDEPAPRPAAQPGPRTRRRAAREPVSAAAFASWLATHPDWERDAARAAGKADANYLLGFDAASAGGGAMVGVSWWAARAYCAGRGGLADVAAPPLTWSEDAGHPFQEWRIGGGKGAWRRFDGAASDKLDPAAGNAFTGFRCAR